jgi:hypothetical protein
MDGRGSGVRIRVLEVELVDEEGSFESEMVDEGIELPWFRVWNAIRTRTSSSGYVKSTETHPRIANSQ